MYTTTHTPVCIDVGSYSPFLVWNWHQKVRRSSAVMPLLWWFMLLHVSSVLPLNDFTLTKSPADTYQYYQEYDGVPSAVRCSHYCIQLPTCIGFTYGIVTSTCSLIPRQSYCIDYSVLVENHGDELTYIRIPVIDPSLALGEEQKLFK